MDAATLVSETVLMPRQTSRPPGPDEWASARIRYERDKLGWSTAELARRVTSAGVPIRQPQVWQIESGTPRRKLTVGEATAFAHVFGISLTQLLTPPSEEFPVRLVQLAGRFRDWLLAEGKQAEELAEIERQIADLDEDEAYTAEQVSKFAGADAGPAVIYIEALIAKYRQVIDEIGGHKSGWDVVAGSVAFAPPDEDGAPLTSPDDGED